MQFDSFQEIFQLVRQNPKLIIADDYELSFQRIERHSVKYRNGEEALKRKEEKYWISLRIFMRKRWGRAVVNNVSKESLNWLIENAFLSAESSSVDPWFKFPLWKMDRPESPVTELDLSETTSLYGSCRENEVLDEKYEVTGVRTTLARKSEKKTLQWFCAQYGVQLGLLCKGETGRFWVKENRMTSHVPKERAQWLAGMQQYASDLKRAIPAKVASGEKIILGPAVLARLLREIAPQFSYEAILQDKSAWEGKREARIFSPAMNLIDDGNYPGSAFSAPFDMEGTPSQKTVLVEQGYLKNFLYDTYHAIQENRLSTGNYIRGADSDAPHIGPTNLFFEPSATTLSDMEGQVDRGFILQSLEEIESGAQKPDEKTLLCSGWRVENGRRTQAVRQVELHVDMRQLFETASQVADDLTFYGGYGSPSILFENIL